MKMKVVNVPMFASLFYLLLITTDFEKHQHYILAILARHPEYIFAATVIEVAAHHKEMV
jgi:hypothetical protein